jgi:retinol dehydrogenase-16
MPEFYVCLKALALLVVLYKVFDWLLRRFYVGNYSQRYVFITGCDTGFGNLIVKRLDALGCRVFAGCLTEVGETDLKKSCSERLQVVSLDVSKPESVENAFNFVKSKLPQGKGLWAVLNNAGILGQAGSPDWLTVDNYRSVAAVNLYGMIDVTMTFLPLVKAAKGRVVNVSSVAGRLGVPVLLPYCLTKFGIEAFSDGLRRAMYSFNVKVILVEPGWTKTAITSSGNTFSLVSTSWNQASPDIKAEYGEEYFKYCSKDLFEAYDRTGSTCFDRVVDAYQHATLGLFPRARYVVGMDAKYVFLPLTVMPEWLSDWLLFKSQPNQPLPAVLRAGKTT